jgi:hypothetical protein
MMAQWRFPIALPVDLEECRPGCRLPASTPVAARFPPLMQVKDGRPDRFKHYQQRKSLRRGLTLFVRPGSIDQEKF